MYTMQRNLCFSILLVLVIGHAALTLHIATHVTADSSNCELCTGQTTPEVAPPPVTTELLAVQIMHTIDVRTHASVTTTLKFSPARQRAPPVLT